MKANMISKNMNYCFNVEYYKDLKYIYYIGQRGHDTEKEEDEGTLKDRDIYIENFDFAVAQQYIGCLKNQMKTTGCRLNCTQHTPVC